LSVQPEDASASLEAVSDLSDFGLCLRVLLGLAQTGNPIPRLPLVAFLEQFDTLEALQDISFAAQRGSGSQTTML